MQTKGDKDVRVRYGTGNLGCDRHLGFALQGWGAGRGVLPGHVEASVWFWLRIPSYGAAETGEITIKMLCYFFGW